MRAAFALAIALAAAPAAAAEYRALGDKPAVLYDAPSTRADRLFVASRYYPFEVLVKLDQWTKVRDFNGEVAWVENGALGARATVLVTVPLADVRAPNAASPLALKPKHVIPGIRRRGRRLDQGAPPRRAAGFIRVAHVQRLRA
jgi:hypothetical protein